MTPKELLRELEGWRDAGWLRHMDVAFARFINEFDPQAPAGLLLAAALTVQLEGRGHSALPLAEMKANPEALLDWPLEGISALRPAWAECLTDADLDAHVPPMWLSRSVLEVDPQDDTGASPMVLCRGLLYLRRYWRYESRVAAQIRARAGQRVEPDETAAGAVNQAKARRLLDVLFGAAGTDTDWQKIACAIALRGSFTIITGGPGTGKTYTAARLLVLLQALHDGPQPLRVALAAPTGKAAARLRQSIQKALRGLREQAAAAIDIGDWAERPLSAGTLHALLGTQSGTRRFRHDAANPLDVDLLIVDEASMVHLEMMAQLLEALPRGAKLVLLGDKDQLASVEAGAVMGDLCHGVADHGQAHGYGPQTLAWLRNVADQSLPPQTLGQGARLGQQTVALRKSHRFDGPIGRVSLAINAGDAEEALRLLKAHPGGAIAIRAVASAGALIPLAIDGREGAPFGYRAYLEQLAQRPPTGQSSDDAFDEWAKGVLKSFDSFRVLTAVREGGWGVAGLNAAIERSLAAAGLISRRGEWYEGRPVMVTRNDADLGVFNGDVGVVLKGPGKSALRCYFLEGDQLRSVSVARLAEVETAFAMTVHKSQGSEFAHVLLVLPDEDVPVLTRELVYTGVTRAREAFTLVGRSTNPLIAAARRPTRRVSGLRMLLAHDTA